MTHDRKEMVRRWLEGSVAAIDPEERVAVAVSPDSPKTVIAIGKAAAAMCRGADRGIGGVVGVCVTNMPGEVPDGIDLLVGDHPVPGAASFEAGRRVIETAMKATEGVTALISGGGSALCEQPLSGIDPSAIQMANSRLLDGGASIEETNLVRRHLSAIKCGGVTRAATGPVDTYIVSDVSASGPEIVASGPTIFVPPDPEKARQVMNRYGIPVDDKTWEIISRPVAEPGNGRSVHILADGRIAAQAVVDAASEDRVDGVVMDGWIGGNVDTALGTFISGAGPSLTVAAGEPNVEVKGRGVGGRNSHAALLAARKLAGSDMVFAAFATDGVDGRSDGAGAVVDGTTIERGGDPSSALAESDSATYLEAVGDLIRTGPTGTNVSDLWLLWQP